MSKFWDIYDQYIKREGAQELKRWMLSTDFDTAPGSTRYHDSYRGGLADHSVRVWEHLVRLLKAYPEVKCSAETAAIISLLHDLGKIFSYTTELRNKKDEFGKWVQVPVYKFEERVPYGNHGGKAVFLVQQYMKLTEEEAISLQNHMGAENGNWSVADAFRAYPLAFLLHTADMASTIPNIINK